jgi:hypothetical protein
MLVNLNLWFMQDAYFMIEMCRLKLSLIWLVTYQERTVSSNVVIPTAVQFLSNRHLYDPYYYLQPCKEQ